MNDAAEQPAPPPADGSPRQSPPAGSVQQEQSSQGSGGVSNQNQAGGDATFNSYGHNVSNYGLSGEDIQRIQKETAQAVLAGFRLGRGFAIPDYPVHRHLLDERVDNRVVSQKDEPKDGEEYAEQFSDLDEEEKLFVVVLYLFPAISWTDFWEIYDQAAAIVLPQIKPKPVKQGNKDDHRDVETELPPGAWARSCSDEHWARVAHATIEKKSKEYIEGKESTTTINFRSPQVRNLAKTYLSTQQRQWLLRLLPVLYQLGSRKVVSVGIRKMAAEAVAVIANIDFEHVRGKVLNAWSRSEEPATRAAVGYALDKLIREKENDAGAVALLNMWSNPQGEFYWRQSWTAAVAYRLVGLHRFDLAAKDLKSLARIADQTLNKYAPRSQFAQVDFDLMQNLPDAVSYTLIVLAMQGKAHEIICLLRDWCAEGQPMENHPFADLTIASTIAGILDETFHQRSQRTPRQGSNETPVDGQPSDFLDLLKEKEVRTNLADILYYIYDQGVDWRQGVSEMLKTWVRQMADLGLELGPVQRIIVNLFKRCESQNRERILQAMDRWAQDKNNAVHTVGRETARLLRASNYPLPPPRAKASNRRIIFGDPTS